MKEIIDIQIQKNYLRDMDSYPFPPRESGENTNPQLDKCNNFNYRKMMEAPLV